MGRSLGRYRDEFHYGDGSELGNASCSTPILFGENAAAYGLTPNTVYYVASTPTLNANNTYTFQILEQWLQTLSKAHIVRSRAPAAIPALSSTCYRQPAPARSTTEWSSQSLSSDRQN